MDASAGVRLVRAAAFPCRTPASNAAIAEIKQSYKRGYFFEGKAGEAREAQFTSCK